MGPIIENNRKPLSGTNRLKREFGLKHLTKEDVEKMYLASVDGGFVVQTVYRNPGNNLKVYKKVFERCVSEYPDMRSRLNEISR